MVLKAQSNRWQILSILLLSVVHLSSCRHSYHDCNDKPIELAEEDVNVIFTGTVRGIYPDWQHPNMQKAQVEVKRVIKGNNVINTLPGINRFNPWARKMVMVDGIGDPDICKSKARKYDTRIWLLNKNGHGELKLNASLVRLTLHNLEVADAAVKGEVMMIF